MIAEKKLILYLGIDSILVFSCSYLKRPIWEALSNEVPVLDSGNKTLN
jgi:hypothetical protein